MGYELNKLMKQYGVATPGMVRYTGPAAPGAAPVESAYTGKKDSPGDAAKFAADKAAFDEAMRKYNLGQKEYNQYRTDYMGRIGATPMYYDQQFYTGPSAGEAYVKATPNFSSINDQTTEAQKRDLYRNLRNEGFSDQTIRDAAATRFGKQAVADEYWNALTADNQPTTTNVNKGIGVDQYNTNITDWIAKNPTATAQEMRNQMDKYGISAYDVARARGTPGSMWGDTPLAAPTYGAIPASIANQSQQYKTDYYKRLRDIGYTDADIRGEATKTFGKLPDADWNYLRTQAGYPSPVFVDPVGPPISTPPPEEINIGLDPNLNPNDGLQRGGVMKLAKKYQLGGAVRKFSIGGNEGEPVDPIEALIRERGGVPGTTSPVVPQATPVVTDLPPAAVTRSVAPVTDSPAAKPVTPPPAATTPVSPAAGDLMSMMNRYLSAESMYGPELKTARERVSQENTAFQKMIADAMKLDGAAPDKAEMYFRLAAAFGAPTKTGHFTENLGLVGKELGEYAKDVRTAKKADRALRLQLGLEAQKLKAQSAKEELASLRTLTAEEMKDKRAVMLEYIKSGAPQSEAGKAAKDMGLIPGSQEYNDYVNKYIERKFESGDLYKQAMLAVAQGNLAVAQAREGRATQTAGRLTTAEIKLKAEAEDAMGSIDDAMTSLKRAYSLNPNTFDGTLIDIGRRKILEQTDPKDPRVLATREQQNLLSKGAISNLRTAFGGNPTEGERKALLDLEGIDSKSKEERAQIMRNTYKLLKARRNREQKRLNDISAGLYRETTPSAGELD